MTGSFCMHVASWPGSLSANAFLSIMGEALARKGVELLPVDSPRHPPIAHSHSILVQWPDQVFWRAKHGVPYLRAAHALYGLWKWKRSGKKIVWVVHNDRPHDLSPAELRLWNGYSNLLSRIVDGYMTLSPATQPVVASTFPALLSKPSATFRHPTYPSPRITTQEIAEYRARLAVPEDALLIGALGRIGQYKGIPDLVRAVRDVEQPKLRMLIHGRPRGDAARKEIISSAQGDNRVIMNFDIASDNEYSLALAACDKLVAPYSRYLHSGSLVHYVSAGKSVLTPLTPFSADLKSCVGDGWLYLYEGRLDAATLNDFLSKPSPCTPPRLEQLSGDQAASAIITFLHRL